MTPFRSLAHVYADNHPRMRDPQRPPCVRGDETFGDTGGITNGAAWYSVKGGQGLSIFCQFAETSE